MDNNDFEMVESIRRQIDYHRKLHKLRDIEMNFIYKANYVAVVLSLIATFISCGVLISLINHLR